MGKIINFLLFMLAATVLNIVLMVVLFILAFVLLGFVPDSMRETVVFTILTGIAFVLPIVLTFVIYKKTVNWAFRKYKLENNLAPILSPRKNKVKRDAESSGDTGTPKKINTVKKD